MSHEAEPSKTTGLSAKRTPPTAAVESSRVVPASGYTAALTWAASAAMAFLAVLALAMAISAGHLASRWEATMAQTATLRLSAPPAQLPHQTETALEILRTTPGIASVRVIQPDEQRALLEPWFGPDIPVEALALPRLIEIVEGPEGFDPVNLRLRLAGEAPGAVLDDHSRWRGPMIQAAERLRLMALGAVALTGIGMAAMVTLAAGFALAANAQVIQVLRLIGARDTYIARAFTRRFTIRAFLGALVGAVVATIGLLALPSDNGGVLAGVGPQGLDWLAPLLVPLLAGVVAWVTTRFAAMRVLRRQG